VTGYHLAQLNVGRPRGPVDSAEMAAFMSLIDPINKMADTAPGFVWRLQGGDGPGATALRPYGPEIMVNMSVWQTLDALQDFTYRIGPHLDAMRRRREWFHKMAEQHLVLWWIPAGHLPDLDEALRRLELLRGHGPGPLAFTFREPYGPPPPGQPASPERASAMDIARSRMSTARSMLSLSMTSEGMSWNRL
jgi:Domain of unknown function (DUF3291)